MPQSLLPIEIMVDSFLSAPHFCIMTSPSPSPGVALQGTLCYLQESVSTTQLLLVVDSFLVSLYSKCLVSPYLTKSNKVKQGSSPFTHVKGITLVQVDTLS